jgi:alkanesulfonate monooxygenase SsuD/methylene tetrahydromethanopterin reductase-like flavin-dependent oxidoreductase (luciferase family)
VWRSSPASFEGSHYRFTDVWAEPEPWRPEGPALWFGGSTLHERLLARLVRYGSGFHPLGRPSGEELDRLRAAMTAGGRDPAELEMVGGTRGTFPDASGVADLGEALATIPSQVEAGFTTICVKPSQFIDDPSDVPRLCRDIVRRVAELVP